VHYLLVKQLEAAGLKYTDIETIFLKPGDARVAFEQGKADAWVIWDPFFAAAEKSTGAKILADGKNSVANTEFY
jgi:sulfonate transport system substrate-binding protein